MAFALYKLPFLSLQQAVLHLFPFELQSIQMYLTASALLLACVCLGGIQRGLWEVQLWEQ